MIKTVDAFKLLKEVKSKDNTLEQIDVLNHIEKIANDFEEEKKELQNIFPLQAIPDLFRALIIECNKSLNFPIDYIATAILAACSVIIGKGAQLKVKEGWKEFAAFFFAIVGGAGANKSHPLEVAIKPIIEKDKENVEDFANKIAAYDTAVKEKVEVDDNFQPIEKPVLKKILLNDATPEIKDIRLADNERGCLQVTDELATWINNMNAYSKGDQTSKYLSIWSNKYISVDRVKNPKPVIIEKPFLSIIGTLQPKVLPQLFGNKLDNGFLQRFLFSFPNYTPKEPINENQLNVHTFEAYRVWALTFADRYPMAWDETNKKYVPKTFKFNKDAKAFFYEWQAQNTEKVNEFSDSVYGEVYSKFDVHFCRLALLIQCMTNFEVYEVELPAVQAAAALCQYYVHCSEKVLELILNDDKTAQLPNNKQLFINDLPKDFTTGEAVKIGEKYDLSERATRRFINQKEFFKKVKHGTYSKI